MKYLALKPFRIAEDGNHYGRQVHVGEEVECNAAMGSSLVDEGYLDPSDVKRSAGRPVGGSKYAAYEVALKAAEEAAEKAKDAADAVPKAAAALELATGKAKSAATDALINAQTKAKAAAESAEALLAEADAAKAAAEALKPSN